MTRFLQIDSLYFLCADSIEIRASNRSSRRRKRRRKLLYD
jgi:hypothetical protein